MIHFMNETPLAVTWTSDPATAVELVRTLHDLPWAADRAEVERLVAEHPGWKIRRELDDLLAIGLFPTGGTELYFDATAPKEPHYRRIRLMRLLDFAPTATPHERRAALRLAHPGAERRRRPDAGAGGSGGLRAAVADGQAGHAVAEQRPVGVGRTAPDYRQRAAHR